MDVCKKKQIQCLLYLVQIFIPYEVCKVKYISKACKPHSFSCQDNNAKK